MEPPQQTTIERNVLFNYDQIVKKLKEKVYMHECCMTE